MKTCMLTFLVVILASFAAFAAPQTIVIPAGTAIHIKLKQTIDTANAKVGQHVPAELTQPVIAGGRTIANAGSAASVRTTAAEASGRMGGNSQVRLQGGGRRAFRGAPPMGRDRYAVTSPINSITTHRRTESARRRTRCARASRSHRTSKPTRAVQWRTGVLACLRAAS